MRKLTIALGLLLTTSTGHAQTAPQLRADNIEEVMAAMTTAEKVRLLVGTGMPGVEVGMPAIGSTRSLVPGAAGTTYPIERLGIPAIVLSDGPAGLRIDPTRDFYTKTYYCTHFPIGTSLSSSWNTALVEAVGQAIGNEVHEYGADVILGPGNNIQRNPLCGRNYEYYSEDPLLSGTIAAAYIRGVQRMGVGATLKHFCFNNQETKRLGNNAIVSKRAAREIYLRAFEIAVKQGRPWLVMTSYNKVNGRYTSERRDLLTTILRDEWGFDGVVVTDWFGGKDRSANISAGNDMIQPGLPFDPDSIMAGVKDGRISPSQLDQSVRRVLRLIVRSPHFKGYAFSNSPDLAAHAEVTRHSATEGIVLLKNNGMLPLGRKVKRVAVYGVSSYDIIPGGTGSGNVNRAYTVSLIEGLRNNGYTSDNGILETYRDSLSVFKKAHECDKLGWWEGTARMADFVPSADSLAAQASRTDAAVITLGRVSGEGIDRKASDFYLTPNEQQLVARVCSVFHSVGKQVVVILNVGGVVETASWKHLPDAILLPWQCGQEGGNSMADVLSGAKYPSGKLPMTFPIDLMDVPSSANMPMDGADITLGVGQKDESNNVRNVDYTRYEEGIWVGYRYFDTFDKNVAYPFGYGLSYTTFSYSEPRIAIDGDKIVISVTVNNTGRMAGKEVVEVYASAPKDKMEQPRHELKAFAKTDDLQPGQSQVVSMTIDRGSLSSFSEKASAWVGRAGRYRFGIGALSRDIRLTLSVRLPAYVQKVHDVLD